MLIRSQDKMILADDYGSKVKMYFVQGYDEEFVILYSDGVPQDLSEALPLAKYSTLEKAIKVLDLLEAEIIADTYSTCFQFPNDDEVDLEVAA